MAHKTLTELRAEAQVIRNETVAGANTAVRVGTLLDESLENLDSLVGNLWEFKLDGTYVDQPSGIAIAAGIKTKVTIDGTGDEQKSPNYSGNLWNTITNKFEPFLANDLYMMRLAITGESDAAAVNRFEIEFDVGGTTGVIGRETGVFAKGAGTPQSFNFVSNFFAGGDFLTNGGEIFLTPLADATFWEIAVTISRTYTPMT